MVKIRTTLAICSILLIQSVVSAQERADGVIPFDSKKKDVVRILGEPSSVESDRFRYDLSDQTIEISFYTSGCGPDIERKLGLVSGSVVEVRSTPKRQTEIDQYLRDRSSYKSYELHGGENLYYDPDRGVVVTARTTNATEFIKTIFKVGRVPNLHTCLLGSLDQNSALAELHYFGAMTSREGLFKFPQVSVGRFFEEDSERAKDEIIADFVKELIARKNSFGIVMINGAENDPKADVESRTTTLIDRLAKAGIPCTRLVVDNGLRGGLPGASFTVVHQFHLKETNLKTRCP